MVSVLKESGFHPEVEIAPIRGPLFPKEYKKILLSCLLNNYQNSIQYCSKMRSAVLKEWDIEKSSRKRLLFKSKYLEFKKNVDEMTKRSIWGTSFPVPGHFAQESHYKRISCRINVSDSVYLTWDTSENMKRGLKPDFEIMIGKVKRIYQRTIYASFNLGLNEHPPDYNQDGCDQSRIEYHIRFGPSNTISRRKLEALDRFDTLNPIIQKYILGSLDPNDSCAFCEEINDLPSTLNPSQKEAVAKALTNPFTLIQGPPGCGKTHVI